MHSGCFGEETAGARQCQTADEACKEKLPGASPWGLTGRGQVQNGRQSGYGTQLRLPSEHSARFVRIGQPARNPTAATKRLPTRLFIISLRFLELSWAFLDLLASAHMMQSSFLLLLLIGLFSTTLYCPVHAQDGSHGEHQTPHDLASISHAPQCLSLSSCPRPQGPHGACCKTPHPTKQQQTLRP
jgi:hypothetical protein